MPAAPTPVLTTHGVDERSLLIWRVPSGWTAASTAILGGGLLDEPAWILNASVADDYARMDPAVHLGEIAGEHGLDGEGVGLMTAVDVAEQLTVDADGVTVTSTTGVTRPVLAGTAFAGAATAEAPGAPPVGTINTVCWVPATFESGARLNLLTTVAEAKAQALADAGVAGTGTASDAVVVMTHNSGQLEPFGGTASTWGARLGRAVYGSIHGTLMGEGSS